MRQAPYEPPEGGVLTNLDIGQRRGGNRCHMAGPFLDPAKFATIADRASHHAGKLGNNFVIRCAKRLDASGHQRDPFIERACRPFGLRRAGGIDGGGCHGEIHRPANGHNSPVDG